MTKKIATAIPVTSNNHHGRLIAVNLLSQSLSYNDDMLARIVTIARKIAVMYWKIRKPITVGVRIILVKKIDGIKKILLVRHSYMYHDYFFPPGGSAKWGETLEDTIRREYQEEVGGRLGEIEYAAYKLSTIDGNSNHGFFYFSNDFDIKKIDNFEIAEHKWFDVNKLPRMLDDDLKGVKETLEKFVER